MSFLPVSIFRKSIACPSSQTLLAYRKSDLRQKRRDWVEAHLVSCEFCRAELQLLNRYRQVAERVTAGEVPAELREFAESALANIARIESANPRGYASN